MRLTPEREREIRARHAQHVLTLERLRDQSAYSREPQAAIADLLAELDAVRAELRERDALDALRGPAEHGA